PVNDRWLTAKELDCEGAHQWGNRPPPVLRGAVDVEVADGGEPQTIEMRVRFAEHRARALAPRVDAQRRNSIDLRRELPNAFVLGRSVRIDKLLDACLPGRLQDRRRPGDVDLSGFHGIWKAGQKAVLCREMEDGIHA